MEKFETLDDLAKHLGGSAWTKKDNRIYFNGYGKDIRAYLIFDSDINEFTISDEGYIVGAELKVYSNAIQDINWKINRAKQIKFQIMKQIAKITNAKIVESWQEICL